MLCDRGSNIKCMLQQHRNKKIAKEKEIRKKRTCANATNRADMLACKRADHNPVVAAVCDEHPVACLMHCKLAWEAQC